MCRTFALALFVLIAGVTRADVIGTVPVQIDVVHPWLGVPVLKEIEFNFLARPKFPKPSDPIDMDKVLFNGIVWTESEIGKSYSVTADTDPEFLEMAALLANGEDNAVAIGFVTRAKDALTQRRFSALPEGYFLSIPGGVDFDGYSLTRISQRLDALTIGGDVTPIPTFPEFHGPQFSGQITLTFEGTPVPEPASAGLMLLGFAGALQVRGRRATRAS
jgi:hypothetical protein